MEDLLVAVIGLRGSRLGESDLSCPSRPQTNAPFYLQPHFSQETARLSREMSILWYGYGRCYTRSIMHIRSGSPTDNHPHYVE